MSAPSAILRPLSADGLELAQESVTRHHYLHKPVDQRSMPEGYAVEIPGTVLYVGYLLVGRPQATRCQGWYGSLEDVASGWAEVSRWQVLNLSRVWLSSAVQRGGPLHRPDRIP